MQAHSSTSPFWPQWKPTSLWICRKLFTTVIVCMTVLNLIISIFNHGLCYQTQRRRQSEMWDKKNTINLSNATQQIDKIDNTTQLGIIVWMRWKQLIPQVLGKNTFTRFFFLGYIVCALFLISLYQLLWSYHAVNEFLLDSFYISSFSFALIWKLYKKEVSIYIQFYLMIFITQFKKDSL